MLYKYFIVSSINILCVTPAEVVCQSILTHIIGTYVSRDPNTHTIIYNTNRSNLVIFFLCQC